eukprot:gene15844-24212_t
MGKKGKKEGRTFDMTRYRRKHVALRFSYIGTAYQGLALQDHTTETVEGRLFEALRRVRLIAEDEKVPEGFSRCGRTDKGVSALGQVCAMRLRSAQNLQDEAAMEDTPEKELDYVGILNRVLPGDIRVSGWAFVEDNFSARFSCSGRVYKYFFFKGAKDIAAMRQAAAQLVGEHDFRNFAKLDVVHVSNFVRRIFDVTIAPAAEDLSSAVWVITVVGSAFLYHQVRCMVSVLFDVGDGLESPALVPTLLDIGKTPSRPSYTMAPPFGLVLWDCLFPSIRWNACADSFDKLVKHFEASYQQAFLAPMILGHVHHHLRDTERVNFLDPKPGGRGGGAKSVEGTFGDLCSKGLVAGREAGGNRVAVLKRPVEKSYDEKLSDLRGSKKARLDANLAKGAREDGDDGDPDAKRIEYAPRVELTDEMLRRYMA